MGLQSRFRSFHEAIKLSTYAQDPQLRARRDRLLEPLGLALRRRLSRARPGTTFEFIDLGSCTLGTGVQPLDGDYDIDVAVVVNVDVRDFGPGEVKGWVMDAASAIELGPTSLPELDLTQGSDAAEDDEGGHGATEAEWREACVTVQIDPRRQVTYHADLAVYGRDGSGDTFLAHGLPPERGADSGRWMETRPRALARVLSERYKGLDNKQLRRVIRYLKRWKDHVFEEEPEEAPSGLALTAAAYRWFSPASRGFRYGGYDDAQATLQLVRTMVDLYPSWSGIDHSALRLPIAPRDDLLSALGQHQRRQLLGRLEVLRDALKDAQRLCEWDKPGACQVLREVFGDDFPED